MPKVNAGKAKSPISQGVFHFVFPEDKSSLYVMSGRLQTFSDQLSSI